MCLKPSGLACLPLQGWAMASLRCGHRLPHLGRTTAPRPKRPCPGEWHVAGETCAGSGAASTPRCRRPAPAQPPAARWPGLRARERRVAASDSLQALVGSRLQRISINGTRPCLRPRPTGSCRGSCTAAGMLAHPAPLHLHKGQGSHAQLGGSSAAAPMGGRRRRRLPDAQPRSPLRRPVQDCRMKPTCSPTSRSAR